MCTCGRICSVLPTVRTSGRLRELEVEKGALTEKLQRQQQQLREGFTSRDETIRQFNDAAGSPALGAGIKRGS